MAVYTYGASDISFSSFNTWANNVGVEANTSLSGSLSDFYPTNAAPFQVSEFSPNTSIFYGTVTAENGGNVELTAPYTVAQTTTFKVKNFLISTYSITMVATATYPYSFHSWRDASGGLGNQLSTNTSLTLTDVDHTGVTVFYAYFTTSHIDPPF